MLAWSAVGLSVDKWQRTGYVPYVKTSVGVRSSDARPELCLAREKVPARMTFKNRMLAVSFKLSGDIPYDYRSMISKFGCMPEIEAIGLSRAYQLVRVTE